MRLVHLSDVHFGAEDKAVAEAAADAARAFAPDAVIVTGDLTLGGRRREFRAASAWLASLPRPLLVTPGNHDVPYWNLPLRAFAPFSRYRRLVGSLSASAIDLTQVVVRAVNTSRGAQARLNWSKGAVDLAAIRRACAEMAAAEAALRVIACHHPLIETASLAMSGRVRRGADAASLLAEAGVDLILSGHVHAPFAIALPGHRTYAAGAGTLSLRTRGAPAGYSTIEADAKTITITALAWSVDAFRPFQSWSLPRRPRSPAPLRTAGDIPF